MTIVLVVDDDPAICRTLSINLRARDYEVETAGDGRSALQIVDERMPDVILLDLGLPDLDGVEVIRRLRGSGSRVPIVVLSSRNGETEKVEALDLGADDYVTKPFHMEELLARIRAVLRRSTGHASSEIVCGAVRLDTRSGRVAVGDNPVKLTSHEYRLLSYLMHHAGRIVSRAELTEHLYDQDFDRDSNTIEVFVSNLRRKLEAGDVVEVGGERFEVGS